MSARNSLVKACISSVAQSGLDGIATSRIAREAGVATGTLFHHFPDKVSLLSFAYLSLCQRLALEISPLAEEEKENRSAHVWNRLIRFWLRYSDEGSFFRQMGASTYRNSQIKDLELEIFEPTLKLISGGPADELGHFNLLLLLNISLEFALRLHQTKPQDKEARGLMSFGFSICEKLMRKSS